MLAAGLGEVAGAVDVGGPEGFLVDLIVREHGGAVDDGGEIACGEEKVEHACVADVALNTGEVRVGVGVGNEVDVGAGVAFGEEAALEDASEEAGSAGDEDVFHRGPGALAATLRRGVAD